MWAGIEATMARQIRRVAPVPLAAADATTRAVAARRAHRLGELHGRAAHRRVDVGVS